MRTSNNLYCSLSLSPLFLLEVSEMTWLSVAISLLFIPAAEARKPAMTSILVFLLWHDLRFGARQKDTCLA